MRLIVCMKYVTKRIPKIKEGEGLRQVITTESRIMHRGVYYKMAWGDILLPDSILYGAQKMTHTNPEHSYSVAPGSKGEKDRIIRKQLAP